MIDLKNLYICFQNRIANRHQKYIALDFKQLADKEKTILFISF